MSHKYGIYSLYKVDYRAVKYLYIIIFIIIHPSYWISNTKRIKYLVDGPPERTKRCTRPISRSSAVRKYLQQQLPENKSHTAIINQQQLYTHSRGQKGLLILLLLLLLSATYTRLVSFIHPEDLLVLFPFSHSPFFLFLSLLLLHTQTHFTHTLFVVLYSSLHSIDTNCKSVHCSFLSSRTNMSVPMPPSTTAPPPSQAPPTPVHHHHQQQQQQPPIVQKLAAVNEQAWLTLGAYTLNLLFFLHWMGCVQWGLNVRKKRQKGRINGEKRLGVFVILY